LTAPHISIEGRKIGADQPCFIIAEIGVNHNGDPEQAMQMIDSVAEAGADCVKFQTFSADEFVNDDTEIYEYKSQGKAVRESMLDMFRRLELQREEFSRLFAHAHERGVIPLSTPADRAAADLLDELGAGAFKVGSDDLVYTPFLRYVASKGKPVIISTGMAEMTDVERAVRAIRESSNDQICILHCVSLYPTPEGEVNLKKIQTLQSTFGDLTIGFSDHSNGITAALGAVSLGACVIEKHFTLDRDLPGPDHHFSADPEELTALVREVRRLEKELGHSAFELSAAEREMAELCHRSIVIARDLPAGHIIGEDDLAYKRPGSGLMPYDADKVVGRRCRTNLAAGIVVSLEMLEQSN
jgi:N-acetylneuraminate synthase/N,N'-diacetyllegionaminate synthase